MPAQLLPGSVSSDPIPMPTHVGLSLPTHAGTFQHSYAGPSVDTVPIRNSHKNTAAFNILEDIFLYNHTSRARTSIQCASSMSAYLQLMSTATSAMSCRRIT